MLKKKTINGIKALTVPLNNDRKAALYRKKTTHKMQTSINYITLSKNMQVIIGIRHCSVLSHSGDCASPIHTSTQVTYIHVRIRVSSTIHLT